MSPSLVCVLVWPVFVVFATVLPARGEDDAAYVGIWSQELRNCGAEQRAPNRQC